METEIIELRELVAAKLSTFGEYLVRHSVLDRFQLFRVLQMQDRVPGARLGQCAVALGYAERSAIEAMHRKFAQHDELDTMATDAFHREPEIEILYAIT
jgi:hypothetical protein